MIEIETIGIWVKFKVFHLVSLIFISSFIFDIYPELDDLLCHHSDTSYKPLDVGKEIFLNLRGIFGRILVQVVDHNDRV